MSCAAARAKRAVACCSPLAAARRPPPRRRRPLADDAAATSPAGRRAARRSRARRARRRWTASAEQEPRGDQPADGEARSSWTMPPKPKIVEHARWRSPPTSRATMPISTSCRCPCRARRSARRSRATATWRSHEEQVDEHRRHRRDERGLAAEAVGGVAPEHEHRDARERHHRREDAGRPKHGESPSRPNPVVGHRGSRPYAKSDAME